MITNPRSGSFLPSRAVAGLYLDRPRLFQYPFGPPRVLIITGLPGSGKSVAAKAYVEQFEWPSAVVELRRDQKQGWSALPAALATLGLPGARPAAALESISDPTLIVIERLELGLGSDGVPHTVTSTWLSHLLRNPALYLVLVSRVLPVDPELVELIGRGYAQIINSTALAFTPLEAQALWRMRNGTELSAEAAEALVNHSGGLAGAVALACALQNIHDQNQPLLELLTTQLVGSLPDELRVLLSESAVFEELTPTSIEALTGRNDGARVMRALRNYGVLTSDIPAAIHPLVRQVLLDRLRLDQSKYLTVTRRAVEFSLAEGAAPRAWHLAIEAQAWDLAQHVLLTASPRLRQEGSARTIIDWIRALPNTERTSEVDVLLAECQEEVGDLDGALLTLTALRAMAPNAVAHNEYTIRLAIVHQARGETDTAAEFVSPFLDDTTLAPLWRAHVYRIQGIAQALAGRSDDARQSFRQSIAATEQAGDRQLLARLHQNLATVAGRLGRVGEADQALRLAERYWRELDNPPGLAATLNGRAMLCLLRSDFVTAFSLAQQARLHALAGGRLHISALASATCGDIMFAQGKYVDAGLHYQVAADDADRSGNQGLRAYSFALLAHIARLQGDKVRGANLLPHLQDFPSVSVEHNAWLRTGISAVELMLGFTPSLTDLQQLLDDVGSSTEEVRVALLLMLAQAQWYQGQHHEAFETWQEVEALVRLPVGNAFYRLAPLAAADRAFLDAIISSGKSPFAQKVRALSSIPSQSDVGQAEQNQVPLLQIQVLGPEQIWFQGSLVVLPEHGLALLLLLLTLPGPLAEQDVLNRIWGEGVVTVEALRKLVVRLRAIIPRVVSRSNGYYSLTIPREEIIFDLGQFLTLDLRTTSTADLLRFAEAARTGCLRMYDAPWARELRRQMTRRIALTWLEIGLRAEAEDAQERAHDAYERAQHTDPTSDLVARAVLQHAHKIRDRALLIQRYLRYQEALDTELGVEPADDLQILYRQALEP